MTWIWYILMHIQNFIKIHPFVLKILRKNTFLHQSRAITLLLINKFSPFAIPNHTSPISMSMQSLKKIRQKPLKLESGNKVPAEGHIKRFEGITPPLFLWQGIKSQQCSLGQRDTLARISCVISDFFLFGFYGLSRLFHSL